MDLRFNQPNFKAYEQLELLILEALAANDFADEIGYFKLFTTMVIFSSCYYEKGVFQQSNELDPKTFLRGLPGPSNYYRLALAS